MIEIVSIGGVAVLLVATLWVAGRFQRWSQDQARLMRDVSELTAHALVLQENCSQAILRFESTGLIRTVNPAAEELFGYPAYELLGQSIVKLVPDALSTSRQTETLEIRCKDGARFRVPYSAAKLDLARHSYIYLFFGHRPKVAAPRDAAPPAHTVAPHEAAFRQIAGERPAASRSPFASAARIVGRIAGQFETLLTTINGYSELAWMEAAEGSPLREDLHQILTASDRASHLTRRLAVFGGRQLIPLEPVDLNRLVDDLRAQLRQSMPCPVEFELKPMDGALLANSDYLREVILLLCDSASARVRVTDRLQVRTHVRELTVRRVAQSGELKPGKYGVLTISDTGKPLDAEIKDHIFESLYRVQEEMDLELASLCGMIQSLGGGIDVVTGEETGTAFEILLPCVNPGRAAKQGYPRR